MQILTINAGSSSIKYKLFECIHGQANEQLSGLIEGIGEQKPGHFTSHQEAFNHLALSIKELELDVVVHRIVHGGNIYFNPTVIDSTVLKDIKKLSSLAPIHNPLNAQGVEFAQTVFKKAQQVAIFDTGFHHGLPDRARLYPLNKKIADDFEIRRYGFHGINHEYVARLASDYLHKPFNTCQFITLHLGNGASACLIKNGKSIDTSMGFTPLAGLMMGTRCGDIDPAIPGYLASQGLSFEEIDNILNKKSGLYGIAADNDMRRLLARKNQGDAEAQLALDMYIYRVQAIIGSYYAHTPQLDALIFTGGVGENAIEIRESIIAPLSHFGLKLSSTLNNKREASPCRPINESKTPILVIAGDEERFMALQSYELINSV